MTALIIKTLGAKSARTCTEGSTRGDGGPDKVCTSGEHRRFGAFLPFLGRNEPISRRSLGLAPGTFPDIFFTFFYRVHIVFPVLSSRVVNVVRTYLCLAAHVFVRQVPFSWRGANVLVQRF